MTRTILLPAPPYRLEVPDDDPVVINLSAQRDRINAQRATPPETKAQTSRLKAEADRLDRMADRAGGLTEAELEAARERLQHLIDGLC